MITYMLTLRMGLLVAVFLTPSTTLGSFSLCFALSLYKSVGGLILRTEASTNTENATDSVDCLLQGTPQQPAFTQNGDYIIGGVFPMHYYLKTVKKNYSSLPEPLKCTGR